RVLERVQAQFLVCHDLSGAEIIGQGELQPKLGVPAQRGARCLDDDVDFAGLKSRPALRPADRNDRDLFGVTKNGGRYRPAKVDIETLPVALVVDFGKTEIGA